MKTYQEFIANEIRHYGVKGMRWGVRKARKAQKKAAKAQRKARKNKTTNTLTDQELQAVINRMSLEKRYAELTYKPSLTAKGVKFAGGVVGAVGTQIAKEVVRQNIETSLTKSGVLKPKVKADIPKPKADYITPLPTSFS